MVRMSSQILQAWSIAYNAWGQEGIRGAFLPIPLPSRPVLTSFAHAKILGTSVAITDVFTGKFIQFKKWLIEMLCCAGFNIRVEARR